METITEDYVSFETAKLLKEKGFPQDYDDYHALVYNEEDYEDEYEVQRMVLETRIVKAGTLSSYPLGVPEPKCYCPTLQMAMKWLRKVHNIDCTPYLLLNRCLYTYMVIQIDPIDVLKLCHENYDSYEEATEAAIKYCLENLI